MRIYPAPHYTMGGLWVDYNLMTTLDGLYAIGEANFSDHGANRLGASALMQGLADGYFILPYTIGDYLAQAKPAKVDVQHPAFRQVQGEVDGPVRRLLGASGRKTVDAFHRELGRVMWDKCGMSRNAAGLKEAIGRIGVLRRSETSRTCPTSRDRARGGKRRPSSDRSPQAGDGPARPPHPEPGGTPDAGRRPWRASPGRGSRRWCTAE